MTDLYGYDAAYQPNLAAVKSAGGIAVNGYLTGQYATTTSSPAHALAAGLGWWATYEEGTSELVWASRDVGRAVGQKILTAFKALRDDKGQPLPLDGSLAVYPSVDVSVPDPAACDESFPGIRDVIGGKIQLRYYGQGSIGDHLTRAGLLDGPFWLAAPSSWPGFNVADPNICLVQLVGTNVPSTDRNHLVTQPSALGALWPTGSAYTGGLTVSEASDILAAIAALRADIDARFTYVYPDGSKVSGTAQGITRNEIGAAFGAHPASTSGLTEADVETAVRNVFKSAGGAA